MPASTYLKILNERDPKKRTQIGYIEFANTAMALNATNEDIRIFGRKYVVRSETINTDVRSQTQHASRRSILMTLGAGRSSIQTHC
jgi:hypothetical protein